MFLLQWPVLCSSDSLQTCTYAAVCVSVLLSAAHGCESVGSLDSSTADRVRVERGGETTLYRVQQCVCGCSAAVVH